MVCTFNAPLQMLSSMEVVDEEEAAKMKSFLGASGGGAAERQGSAPKTD